MQSLTGLSHSARGRMDVLCGEDLAFLDHFQMGGRGAIPAAAHLYPERYVEVMQLARDGHAEAARELFERCAARSGCCSPEPNPAPIKRALALQG